MKVIVLLIYRGLGEQLSSSRESLLIKGSIEWPIPQRLMLHGVHPSGMIIILSYLLQLQGPIDNTKEILTSHISLPTTSTTEKKGMHTKEIGSIIDHSSYEPIPKTTKIPQSTIQNILQRAEDLLASLNAIATAFVEGVARMVKSESNPC